MISGSLTKCDCGANLTASGPLHDRRYNCHQCGQVLDCEGMVLRDPGPVAYPAWTASYSNECFDRTQQYATELTEADRRAGRPAPAHGYSKERVEQAEREVRAANRYSAESQARAR